MPGLCIGEMRQARQLHCHSEMGRFAPFHVAFGAFPDGEGLRYIGIAVELFKEGYDEAMHKISCRS